MKWEPIAAMVALLVLGLWIVWGPVRATGVSPREGAATSELRMGDRRGVVEVFRPDADSPPEIRFLLRGERPSESLSRDEFIATFGGATYERLTTRPSNPLFRLLNITSWGSLVWIAVGFAGQAAFFGRMFIQWLVSERSRQSIIPPAFWWLSLGGGVALFAYFAWRQDAIGVLGQTSGVVIYARNLRLIHKHRRREERAGTGA